MVWTEVFKVAIAVWALSYVFYDVFRTEAWFSIMLCAGMGLFWLSPKRIGNTEG